MEFAKSTAVIERSGDFAEKTFSIGDPVVIMKIMRSKLYSNPVKVLIQEYLCNARDANREAGSTKALEIQGPSVFNKTFEVRDFGIGISPDRMENVFIRYGESTKRKDNTQTGGFGIGAKSGWSYSDSFSITTVTEEDGIRVKRFYAAIIDETEKGSLMKIADDEITEEETGTRIVVPVKEKDIKLFNDYIRQTIYFWKEETNAIIPDGNKKFDYSCITYQSAEWMLIPKSGNYLIGEFANLGSKCLANVDGIQYDINYSAIADCSELTDKKDLLTDIFNNRFILFFKTGEINVAANREELYYDEKTKLAIVSKLKVIERELVGVVEKKLNQETDYFKMVCKWNEFIANNFTFKNSENFLNKFNWHGKNVKVVPRISTGNVLTIRKYFRQYNNRRTSTEVSDIMIHEKHPIYENDEGLYLPHRDRIKTLIAKHKDQTFYVIGYGDVVDSAAVVRRIHRSGAGYGAMYTPAEFKKDMEEDREEFNLDMFGFQKMSTVEKTKKPTFARSTGVTGPKQIMYRTKRVVHRAGYSNWNYLEIEPEQVDLHTETGYYVTTENGYASFDSVGHDLDNTRAMKQTLCFLGDKVDVFFIPKKTVERVQKHKLGFKMKCITELISETFDKHKADIETMLQWKYLKTSCVFDKFYSQMVNNKLSYDIIKKKVNDPELLDIFNKMETIDTMSTKFSSLAEFISGVNPIRVRALNSTFPGFEVLKEQVKNLMKKYELFTIFKTDYGTNPKDALVDYMNMVYENEQLKLAK